MHSSFITTRNAFAIFFALLTLTESAEAVPRIKNRTTKTTTTVAVTSRAALSATATGTSPYKLVSAYNSTNWFSSFDFQALPDPTNGFVEYVSQATAQSLGLAKIVGNRVFMGVDNTTVLPVGSTKGRKSIWITSKKEFKHGIMIGDFAHVPGSSCGTWPAFWTIRTSNGPYGEIDILEASNDATQNSMSLHTSGTCSFNPPRTSQSGTVAEGPATDCSLSTGNMGCSVLGSQTSSGTGVNSGGGGVYALYWTSKFIRIYHFARSNIPANILSGNPDPSTWGLPSANFDSANGGCDIDANFVAQTIYFDTTFCGAGAGGQAWSEWSGCQKRTGVSTCEAYVAANPHAYDESYWLVNSVKIYQ